MQQYTVTKEQEYLLGRECALSAMSIGQGLTLIRKYDFVKHAYGTQAFFMLSIGIERLLKVILIYNHRRKNNNDFPNNAELKKYGHKIKPLYENALKISEEIGMPELSQELTSDPIFDQIVEFLTKFSNTSRYYNLDTLTGSSNDTDEPLRMWNKEINKVIVERHYRHNDNKANFIKELTDAIGKNFLVEFDTDEGKKINNLRDFYLEGMTVTVKQKYGMFYLYCMIRFLSDLLWHLDKNYFPMVSEYFVIFRNSDNAYVKGRKTWNPYEP